MPKYRFYCLDSKERVVRSPMVLEYPDDASSIDEAMQRLNRHIIEVWLQTRLVARLEPRDKCCRRDSIPSHRHHAIRRSEFSVRRGAP